MNFTQIFHESHNHVTCVPHMSHIVSSVQQSFVSQMPQHLYPEPCTPSLARVHLSKIRRSHIDVHYRKRRGVVVSPPIPQLTPHGGLVIGVVGRLLQLMGEDSAGRVIVGVGVGGGIWKGP